MMLSRKKAGILLGAVCVGAAAVFAAAKMAAAPATTGSDYVQQPVERRDITSVYRGAGTISAADAYNVKSLVDGTVLTADFEVGDMVEKGDVLYTIDSTEAAAEVEKAQLTVNAAQRACNAAADAQTVRSPNSGTVCKYLVRVGDTVAAGQEIALVRDASALLLMLDFPAADAAGFAAGQTASLTLSGTFEAVEGVVLSVSGEEQSNGSLRTRSVTIAVRNPGGLTPADAAAGTVNGVCSIGSAHFACRQEQTVTAPSAGKVTQLCVKEGGTVDEGGALAVLSGDELTRQAAAAADELRAAQLSLETARSRMANCTITSPIRGTVVKKDVKAGDTVNLSESASLCTIYDLSFLKLELNVDELKILDLCEGQTVAVTADALPNETYTGAITSVLTAGTTAGGTTTYPVTVRIDNMGRLRPGMNASAQIITASVKNVPAVPLEALLRGSYVLVTAESPSAAHPAAGMTAPEGCAYVKVQTGASDDDFIEITEGLADGDTIAYDPAAASALTGEDAG